MGALLHPNTPNARQFILLFASPLALPTPEFLALYDQPDPVTFAQPWKGRLPADRPNS